MLSVSSLGFKSQFHYLPIMKGFDGIEKKQEHGIATISKVEDLDKWNYQKSRVYKRFFYKKKGC